MKSEELASQICPHDFKIEIHWEWMCGHYGTADEDLCDDILVWQPLMYCYRCYQSEPFPTTWSWRAPFGIIASPEVYKDHYAPKNKVSRPILAGTGRLTKFI